MQKMRKYLIWTSLLLSVWKTVQQIRRDRFLRALDVAQASLAAAVFGSPSRTPPSVRHLHALMNPANVDAGLDNALLMAHGSAGCGILGCGAAHEQNIPAMV